MSDDRIYEILSDERDLILELVISKGPPFIERDYTYREYNPTTSEIRKET